MKRLKFKVRSKFILFASGYSAKQRNFIRRQQLQKILEKSPKVAPESQEIEELRSHLNQLIRTQLAERD